MCFVGLLPKSPVTTHVANEHRIEGFYGFLIRPPFCKFSDTSWHPLVGMLVGAAPNFAWDDSYGLSDFFLVCRRGGGGGAGCCCSPGAVLGQCCSVGIQCCSISKACSIQEAAAPLLEGSAAAI